MAIPRTTSRQRRSDIPISAAGADTIGLLRRLRVRSRKLARIGKEVDRLDEDEGAALEPEQPIEYARDTLANDLEYLAQFNQADTAQDLGISERGWRKIVKSDVTPLPETAVRIREVAEAYRTDSRLGGAGTEP